MGFTPIQNAFHATDATIAQGQTSWEQGLDDAYQAWKNAIAGIEQLLYDYCQTDTHVFEDGGPDLPDIAPVRGLILSGPAPVLYQPTLSVHFQSCLWTPHRWTRHQPQLLPSGQSITDSLPEEDNVIPILESDPLRLEQFCVVLTRDFSWVAALSHPFQAKTPFFAISFNPETVQAVLNVLTERVQMQRPAQVIHFQKWLQGFSPLKPDYIWPMQFSRQILAQAARFESPSVLVTLEQDPYIPSPQATAPSSMAVQAGTHNADIPKETTKPASSGRSSEYDIELLKAIAHEIRTPLATIQTLTRLLLRRKDLPEDVIRRLESIQQECSHQIDRFSLIFRAIELTTTPSASLNHSLTTMSLQQLFNQRMPRWESILERRSLNFNVSLPEDLPAIAIRDPNMLDQILTGLIEQLSHTLPLSSEISLQVTLAGDQLKLQLLSSLPDDDAAGHPSKSLLKAVGQLLMLQPETGNLSLSLPATKEIFNFLGGKLTVRQSHPRGETLTMFLPLDSMDASMLR